MSRAYVTCRDAQDNQFDVEIRVAQGKHQRQTNTFFCGLRLMGEKRPPLESAGFREHPQRLQGHVVLDAMSEISEGSCRSASAPVGLRPEAYQDHQEEPQMQRRLFVFDAMSEISAGSSGCSSALGVSQPPPGLEAMC